MVTINPYCNKIRLPVLSKDILLDDIIMQANSKAILIYRNPKDENDVGLAEFNMRNYKIERLKFFNLGAYMKGAFGHLGKFEGVSKWYKTFKNEHKVFFMLNDKGKDYGDFRLKPNSD